MASLRSQPTHNAAPSFLSVADQTVDFTLISADEVAYCFRLTPYMRANSLYLEAAYTIEATEGYVHVGTAQAVRDYVAYLQYQELRAQLARELLRCSAGSPAAAGYSVVSDFESSAFTSTPGLSEASVPLPQPQRHASPHEPTPRDHVQGHSRPYSTPSTAAENAVLASLSPEAWRDMSETVARLSSEVADPAGYASQPLDCDRTYARHTATLRHWLTPSELAELRGEAAPPAQEDAEDGSGIDNEQQQQQQQQRLQPAATPPTAASALPVPANLPVLEAMGPGDLGRVIASGIPAHPRTLSASTSSSSSTSSSVSEASVAAYRATVRAEPATGCNYASSGRSGGAGGLQPGYGAHIALDAEAETFFIEHVLLPHEWRPRETVTRPRSVEINTQCTGRRDGETQHDGLQGSDTGTPSSLHPVGSASPSLQAMTVPPPSGLLTARQQRRLLELIAVADYMGTQPLVELCATYLAAWLMDRTDEEVVQSFVGPLSPEPGDAQVELTHATAFHEPWLRVASTRASDAAALAGTPAKEASAGQGKAVSATAAAAAAATAAGRKDAKASNNANNDNSGSKKKKKGAAALATKVRPPAWRGKGTVTAAETQEKNVEEEEETGDVLPSRGVTQPQGLLSSDQRLSLVRQLKRDGSIVPTPY